ncbi:hypothetical protein ACFL1B_06315, partial [Nanoarchaeota archaeon]
MKKKKKLFGSVCKGYLKLSYSCLALLRKFSVIFITRGIGIPWFIQLISTSKEPSFNWISRIPSVNSDFGSGSLSIFKHIKHPMR